MGKEKIMVYSLEEKVQNFAICSRVGIILLQFLSNLIIPDHDANVFQKPLNLSYTKTQIDKITELLFKGLTHWDAQYFLHISEYGYTYENTIAFFPLFPVIIRQLSNLTLSMLNYISFYFHLNNFVSMHSMLIIVSVLFNNLLFIYTSKILFNLSLVVLKSQKLAFISSILFCINPASIFFSAVYSESLYCFLIFYGLLQINKNNNVLSCLIMGMTGATRSNGLINLGFVIYQYIKMRFKAKTLLMFSLVFSMGVFLTIIPFVIYQMYCYVKFCHPHRENLPLFIRQYGVSNDYVFPGNRSTWCNDSYPIAYSYVQNRYWNVGFLNYYELKQLPNFLLAFPMIYIVGRGTYDFVKNYKFSLIFLGIVDKELEGELPLRIFPYVAHVAFLTIFGILMVHVQVITRLLASSSPLPYWYSAIALSKTIKVPAERETVLDKLNKKREKSRDSCFYECDKTKNSYWKNFLFTVENSFEKYPLFIKWYFIIYFFIGTVMFSNRLPWT